MLKHRPRRAQSGASMLEILGAVALSAGILVAVSDQVSRFTERRKEQAEAEYLRAAARAATLCIATTGVSGCSGVAWRNPPFTPPNFAPTSPLGANVSVTGQILNTAGGSYSQAQTTRIQALVGGQIATATATGISVDLDRYRKSTRDALLLQQHDVGDTELNTMRTDLLMNQKDINNINNLTASMLSATNADLKNVNANTVTSTAIVGASATFNNGLSATTLNSTRIVAGSAAAQNFSTPVIRPITQVSPSTSCANFGEGAFATHINGSGQPLWCADWGDGLKWREPKTEVKVVAVSNKDVNQGILWCDDATWQVVGGGGRVTASNEGLDLRDSEGAWSLYYTGNGGEWKWTWPDQPQTHLSEVRNGVTYPVWIPRWRVEANGTTAAQVTLKGSIARSEPAPVSAQGTRSGWALRGNADKNDLAVYAICMKTGAGNIQKAASANATPNTLKCRSFNDPGCTEK